MTPKRGKNDYLELVSSQQRGQGKLPRLLAHIQKNMLSRCEQLLEQMFSATDDLLYDLSKRASTNNEENLYFESMREIRIEKQGIVRAFLQAAANNFLKVIESSPGTATHRDSSNLAIMGGEELEIDLARSNMVSRTRESYREALYELTIRLDHLLLQVEITEDNNPLGPQQLAEAFINACGTKLAIDIKARLIVFKLFEKHVLKQLGPIYADANHVLIEAGILPKVPRHLTNAEQTAERPQHEQIESEQPPHPGTGEEPSFNLSLSTLSTLLAAARGSTETPSLNCYVFTTNPGPLMKSPELTNLLTRSQPLADRQLARAPRNIVAETVQRLLAKQDAHAPRALDETEETVINLVSLFFDETLADDNLPLAVHSQLCRLQIPVLKVALKDQSFFDRPDHPVRNLFNTITAVGIGFDDSKPLERDPVYRRIVDIVQTICREYRADEAIFEELDRDLKTLIKTEQRKSSLVERRTSQTEAGKSRIRNAKAAAQNLLYGKLRDSQLPDAVSNFLTTTWLQVLIITHLKHGSSSPEWLANEQTVNDLIWLCQRHEDVRSLQRRERLQPELMGRIGAGLEAAIENPDVRITKVRELESALATLGEENVELAYRELTEEQRETLGRNDPSAKPWDEMTALERQRATYDELASHYFEQAKNIAEGTWIEYEDDQTGRKLRCKLAAKLDAEAYIFVNRLGFKTLERSRKQFAYDMQFDKAKPLASEPFFDRIMNKVVSQLKQAA